MEKLYLVVLVVICLSIIFAPFTTTPRIAYYGRHDVVAPGIKFPTRVGWFLMEMPAIVVFVIIYFTGQYATNIVSQILLFLWSLHYVHRVFLYPLQIVVRKGSTFRGVIVWQGVMYCSCNAFVNAMWIAHIHEYQLQNPIDFRLLVGVVIFLIGFYINKRYDHELIKMRKNGGPEYGVSNIGLFKYIVSPNYFGEIVTWLGFAIAAWSLPSVLFLVVTFMNLTPRAIKNLEWYREQFPAYGRDKKAVIPFVL
jgi:3-oxo-5-alpha-steroid 4-dehydrogenase 1